MTYWKDDRRFMVNKKRSGDPVGEKLFSMIERGIYFPKEWKHTFDERTAACNVIIPTYASTSAPKARLDVWPSAISHAKALHTAYFRGKIDREIFSQTNAAARMKLLRIA